MKTKVQQYVEGVGGVRMWGFCPAIDLLDVAPADGSQGDDEDTPLNICSLMAGDIGCCLKTMVQVKRRSKVRPVSVYLVEKQPEVLARHILLLAIFFDEDLGPRECTEIFLEVYGNTMLRKQTSAYLHTKVEDLVSFLTNGTGLLAGLIDVTLLKFKERDAIEKVFKTWLEDVECDMPAWREKRMRNYFEDRYDYRKNLIDWDYSMSVKDWAEIIHSKVRSCPHHRVDVLLTVTTRACRRAGVLLAFGNMNVNSASVCPQEMGSHQFRSALKLVAWRANL